MSGPVPAPPRRDSDRVYAMSARPGRIIDEVAVAIPRPRDHAVWTRPEFLALKVRLREVIRSEVERAVAGEALAPGGA